MKRILFMTIMVCFLTLTGTSLFSQDKDQIRQSPKALKWISDKGFWITENNIKTPENSIIYFYNNDGVLVYKERIEGFTINLKKKKVLMILKKVLEESVIAWEERHSFDENAERVAMRIKSRI